MIRLFPRAKREWAEAMIAEGGSMLELLRLLVIAWALTLRGRRSMKATAIILSGLNVVAGAGLLVLAATTDVP